MDPQIRPTTDDRWRWACECGWSVTLRPLRLVAALARLHATQAHPRHAR